jgi:hypothetical protein
MQQEQGQEKSEMGIASAGPGGIPNTANKNTDAIKRVMNRLLLAPTDDPIQIKDFFTRVQEQCEPFVAEIAFGYWWLLVRIGAIVPIGQIGELPDLPQFALMVLTDRGRRLLEQGENSPHDPSRYLENVRKHVQSPDDVALGYVNDAVGAWSAGLNRASAVMLGCACERLTIILGKHIIHASIPPWSEKVRKMLDNHVVAASRLLDLVRGCLNQLPEEKRLPLALADALDRRLFAIFDHARLLRNESGHPTGRDVSSEEAEAGLLLFPGFYAFVDGLCKHLRSA